MSYNWCFHSFDHDAYVHALTHARNKIIDSVIDENNQFGDYPPAEMQRYQQVGAQILERGFRYDGLNKTETKIMDRYVFDSFHVLGDEIAFQPESHEFLSPYATSDLPSHLFRKRFWSRPQPIPKSEREYTYLPFFTHLGRRLNQDVPSECEYIALQQTEVVALEQELVKFLATDEGKVLDASYDGNLTNDFLGPVRTVLGKNRALHAQVS